MSYNYSDFIKKHKGNVLELHHNCWEKIRDYVENNDLNSPEFVQVEPDIYTVKSELVNLLHNEELYLNKYLYLNESEGIYEIKGEEEFLEELRVKSEGLEDKSINKPNLNNEDEYHDARAEPDVEERDDKDIEIENKLNRKKCYHCGNELDHEDECNTCSDYYEPEVDC